MAAAGSHKSSIEPLFGGVHCAADALQLTLFGWSPAS
jgi:hypothetical protein